MVVFAPQEDTLHSYMLGTHGYTRHERHLMCALHDVCLVDVQDPIQMYLARSAYRSRRRTGPQFLVVKKNRSVLPSARLLPLSPLQLSAFGKG